MNVNSIDKGLIPTWHKGVTEEDKYAKLERYINDLQILRDSQLEISDKALILLSLNKSGRTDLLQNISLDLIDDINTFIDFIQNAFGRSDMDLRAKLEEICREESESMYSYLNRVVRLYFRCHQRAPMTISELSQSVDSAHERAEIIYFFLKGMRNKKVTEQIKLRLGGGLTFIELPGLAKKLHEVYGDQQATVNNITEELQNLTITDDYNNVNYADEEDQQRGNEQFYDGDEEYSDSVTEENDQGHYEYESEGDRDFYSKNDYCYNCGERGHWARSCPDRERSYGGRCYECGAFGHKAYQCNYKE